jgi:DNA-binding beta-propeller fold protein YncE
MAGKTLSCLIALASLLTGACGERAPEAPVYSLNTDTIYVANSGSNNISAFEETATPQASDTLVSASGSPFRLSVTPTALAGDGISGFGLVVASRGAKSISEYRVDFRTGVLTGPEFTIKTALTPTGAAGWNGVLYVANLEGGVSAFRVTNGGTITEVAGSPFPAGFGPVAIACVGTTTREAIGALYVANSASNNVSGFLIDGTTGALTPFPGSPYPAGTSPAWVDVEPPFYPNPLGGPTLVFVANSGSNDVSVYSIAANGDLGPVPGSPFPVGDGPSSIGIGNAVPLKYVYVGNSRSSNISGFSIDPNTGIMTPLPGSPFASGKNPSAVAVSPGRRLLFAANQGSNNLSAFRIDDSTGALVPLAGSPFAVGQSPQAILYFQVPQ